jgi:hypothetical protein
LRNAKWQSTSCISELSVNRRHELTPPQSIISMFYRADRR